MPRRRLDWWTSAATGAISAITGLSPTATRLGLEVAAHAHKQKLNPDVAKSQLVNFKEQGPRRKRTRYRRRHKKKKLPKGIPVDLSIGGGRVSTKTFFTKNKILPTSKAMPYRRRKSTYKRRTRPRRRRLTKIPLGIPRSKVVRFRYVRTGTLTGTTGALATMMIKANSLDDPTGSLSTALPTTLDQWASMYGKYIVLGSKLTVRFGSTANTGPGMVGIHLHNDATALSDANHYREVGRTRTKTLTTQKDFAIVQMKYSGKKFWRLTNIKDDSEQEGTFSTTPGGVTDTAYYHVFAQDYYNSNTFTVDFSLEEEFIVYLTEPLNVAQSSL